MGFTTSKAEWQGDSGGLTYELRLNLDVDAQRRLQIADWGAIGGVAKSDLWLQLKADITGTRVVVRWYRSPSREPLFWPGRRRIVRRRW
jgi:xylulokinase